MASGAPVAHEAPLAWGNLSNDDMLPVAAVVDIAAGVEHPSGALRPVATPEPEPEAAAAVAELESVSLPLDANESVPGKVRDPVEVPAVAIEAFSKAASDAPALQASEATPQDEIPGAGGAEEGLVKDEVDASVKPELQEIPTPPETIPAAGHGAPGKEPGESPPLVAGSADVSQSVLEASADFDSWGAVPAPEEDESEPEAGAAKAMLAAKTIEAIQAAIAGARPAHAAPADGLGLAAPAGELGPAAEPPQADEGPAAGKVAEDEAAQSVSLGWAAFGAPPESSAPAGAGARSATPSDQAELADAGQEAGLEPAAGVAPGDAPGERDLAVEGSGEEAMTASVPQGWAGFGQFSGTGGEPFGVEIPSLSAVEIAGAIASPWGPSPGAEGLKGAWDGGASETASPSFKDGFGDSFSAGGWPAFETTVNLRHSFETELGGFVMLFVVG